VSFDFTEIKLHHESTDSQSSEKKIKNFFVKSFSVCENLLYICNVETGGTESRSPGDHPVPLLVWDSQPLGRHFQPRTSFCRASSAPPPVYRNLLVGTVAPPFCFPATVPFLFVDPPYHSAQKKLMAAKCDMLP